MIVYHASKSEFLRDSFERDIHLIVRENYIRLKGKAPATEVEAWKESLVAMAKVLHHTDIPDEAGVAIEFGVPQSSKRIDFIVSGVSASGEEAVVVVELKRWSSAKSTDRDGIVIVRFARGESEVSHPSYQVWSYVALLRSFNEAVHEGKIALMPCAYLHNHPLGAQEGVLDDRYQEWTALAPVFCEGNDERERLRSFIARYIRGGDKLGTIVRIENGKVRPSKTLVDSLVAMLKGNREFVLIDDQKVVFEKARALALRSAAESKNVLIVSGGPGTGKSVVAVNLLVELSKAGLLCRYVSKNAAPRAVYLDRLRGEFRRNRIDAMFSGSGVFTESEPNEFDVLVVDEAHRLNEKSGLYGNLGENQIKELIRAAKCVIFFLDEDQRVTLRDIGGKESIESWAMSFGATVSTATLESQFRCNGSDGYLAWLDGTLGIRETANETLDREEFDFRVVDSPTELTRLIEDRNAASNRARLVAGYCWKWVSKRDRGAFDIVMPEFGFQKRWNLIADGSLWIVAPNSVEEVGCIHTCQGLEVEYVGVIVGPDLVVRGGEVVTQPNERASTDKSLHGLTAIRRNDAAEAQRRADAIIKNTYRTLMTRGLRGCYVYCTDPETAEYFRSRISGERRSDARLVENVRSRTVVPVSQSHLSIVARKQVKPYVDSVPFIELRIAAGAFGDAQAIDPEHDQWVVLPEEFRAQGGLFVARVVGNSMNRRVPSDSLCLFRLNPSGTREGKVVVAQHRSISDSDLGGSFTLKIYHSKKLNLADGSFRHTEIRLTPDSEERNYKELVFGPEDAGSVRIVAELIAVL